MRIQSVLAAHTKAIAGQGKAIPERPEHAGDGCQPMTVIGAVSAQPVAGKKP
jgi:hypothetical protein